MHTRNDFFRTLFVSRRKLSRENAILKLFLQLALFVVVVLALDENDVIHLMIRQSLCSKL